MQSIQEEMRIDRAQNFKMIKKALLLLRLVVVGIVVLSAFQAMAQAPVLQERSSDKLYKREIPKPEIRFVVPERGGMQVTTRETQVQAVVYHVRNRHDILLLCNGDTLQAFDFDERQGGLSATVPIKDGGNYIRIIAANTTGVDSAYTLVVKPEALARRNLPKIQIDSISTPIPNALNPETATCSISGRIRGVFDAKGVSLDINGSRATDFSFDPQTGRFSYLAQLTKGSNLLVWKARNLDGAVEHAAQIEY